MGAPTHTVNEAALSAPSPTPARFPIPDFMKEFSAQKYNDTPMQVAQTDALTYRQPSDNVLPEVRLNMLNAAASLIFTNIFLCSHAPPLQSPPDVRFPYQCHYCRKDFKRMQELKRHLRSNLPYCFQCPSPGCSWGHYRRHSLGKHMKEKHQISGFKFKQLFERKEGQIYDPDKLLESMVKGTLSVEQAADLALSMAKEGLAEGQVGVMLWGKRKRFCNGTLISTDTY